MVHGMRLMLLMFAAVGFAASGAALAVARYRLLGDGERDYGLGAIALMFGLFAALCTIAASGQADTWEDAGWQKFVKAYQDAFPPNKRFPSPSLLATNYYNSTMALILGLRQVNGDLLPRLSDGRLLEGWIARFAPSAGRLPDDGGDRLYGLWRCEVRQPAS
jgi:hypothetical protein